MWSYGKHPYGSEGHCWNYRILISKHQDFDGILLETPVVAEHLVRRMLNRNSEERPTADEVLGNEIFNQEGEAQSQFEEAAKLKIPKKCEETPKILEPEVETSQEDRLFNIHLELVEHNILAKKFEEATKYQENLVKFVEYQNSSPEELKTKAEDYTKGKHFIRSFVLFHTAAKLVKLKTVGMAEAVFLKKMVNKMKEAVLEICEEDKSKDIFKNYFISCMVPFAIDHITERETPTVFLKKLGKTNPYGFNGFYLLHLIEENTLGRNYDEAEKIREHLFHSMKLGPIWIKDITKTGKKCQKELQYIGAYTLYLLAARLAKSTINGTEAAEVIYNQLDLIGLLVVKILLHRKWLCDIIFDHIIPSISQFTVTTLQEEGKISEAEFLKTKYEERVSMLMAVLVNLTELERRDENPTSSRKFQESLLQISKLQKLAPRHLNSFGQIYEKKGLFWEAFIFYASAAELAISKLNAEEVVESFLILFRMTMDVIRDYHYSHSNVNPIVNHIRVVMDKLNVILARSKDMNRGLKTFAQCWCLLSIGIGYGAQDNLKRAVDVLKSTIAILRSEFRDKASTHKILVFTILNLAIVHYKAGKKDLAIEFCSEALSVMNHVQDWNSEDQKKLWKKFLKEDAKYFRGESGGIGVTLRSWIERFSLRDRS